MRQNFINRFGFIVLLLLSQSIHKALAVDYNYKQSGADWPGTCVTGQLQSPIDISDVQGSCDNTMNLTMVWSSEALATKVLKDSADLRSTSPTGKYWSYLYASDLTGVISGYRSSLFTVHSPSENHLNGIQYDVELQIVHDLNSDFLTSTGGQAIVSIMFQVDPTLSGGTFFDNYDTTKAGLSTDNVPNLTLNMSTIMSTLINLSGQYYMYQGSQTVPPCQENINWYVYQQVLKITSSQLNSIQSYFSKELKFASGLGNNRMIMPSNGRTVKKGNIQCEEQFIHFFSFFVIYTFLNFFVCKML